MKQNKILFDYAPVLLLLCVGYLFVRPQKTSFVECTKINVLFARSIQDQNATI